MIGGPDNENGEVTSFLLSIKRVVSPSFLVGMKFDSEKLLIRACIMLVICD